MKKFTASICVLLCTAILLCSCSFGSGKTTAPPTVISDLYIQNGVLYNCKDQADENGVYTVPAEVSIIGERAFSNDTSIKKLVIGKNVKQIAECAFYGNETIEEIIIADGVETIGGGAFVGCKSLTQIILPSSVKVLGPYAFYHCEGLEKVKLSENLTEIYEYTFASCTKLESITIPDGVAKINTAAFFDCKNLKDVNFPSALTVLEEAAFALCPELEELDLSGTALEIFDESVCVSCKKLSKVTFPETLKTIGYQAFYECYALSELNIPASVSYIGGFALSQTDWYDDLLEDYAIVGDGVLVKCNVKEPDLSGKGIKAIGSSAFWNAETGYKYSEELSKLVIPEGVTTICDYAFYGSKLDGITLPVSIERIEKFAFDNVFAEGTAEIDFTKLTNLTYIGENAFANCAALKKIELPASVTDVEKYAFFKTGAMESFIKNARETKTNDDDFWISGDGILLCCMVKDKQDSIKVPNGVKIIAGGALAGWDNTIIYQTNEGITDEYWYNAWNIDKVEKVTLPETVEKICGGAFVSATSLEEVNIPEKVSSIGDGAFMYCTNLHDITITDGVKQIGKRAFSYSGLYSIILELTGVEKIGDEVFYGCKNMAWVTFPVGVSDIGSNLLLGCTALRNVYISPKASARVYDIIGNDIYSSEMRNNISLHYYVEN